MKIHTYTVINEIYRYGDLENTEKKYFISPELRDQYLQELKTNYVNDGQQECQPNEFNKEYSKFSYHLITGEETLEIIE